MKKNKLISLGIIAVILALTNPNEDNLARKAIHNHTLETMGISLQKPVDMDVSNFIIFSKGTVTVWRNPARQNGFDFSKMHSKAFYIGILGNWFWVNKLSEN